MHANALLKPSPLTPAHLNPPPTPPPASRKAYRLGKWLQNANALRKLPLTTPYGVLEWVSNGGEGLYYFVEQLTWWVGGLCVFVERLLLIKAGWVFCAAALVKQKGCRVR